uniref:Uncharacterized protein n=1 Tax=Siphoviridae sp. ctAvy12 TaxID=2825371 RepID=A0A8S5URX8_9CAUD|nr:MAG TPA: hypothetical protein [Siphoviridae sp. ctAvy12]DAW67148.1 MAG TPA: hypothetical protein [Caudoviricetes sp.]
MCKTAGRRKIRAGQEFVNTITRAYRVHKFQPGGYIRPLSLYVAAAFSVPGS